MIVLLILTVVIGGLGIFYGYKVFRIAEKQRIEREGTVSEMLIEARELFSSGKHVKAARIMKKAESLVQVGVNKEVEESFRLVKEEFAEADPLLEKLYGLVDAGREKEE